MTVTPDWIAIDWGPSVWGPSDWGPSHLRGWALQDSSVLETRSLDARLRGLDRDGYEAALRTLTEPWAQPEPILVVACGIPGARGPWVNAGYRAVPCTPLGGGIAPAPAGIQALDLRVIPGLSQATPPDVMHGDETRIAGFLALNPGWDGVICLPGAQTRWAEVSAGEVVSFQTFLTAELFDLLAQQSSLRPALTGDGFDGQAFDEALSDAMAKPERLAARLFGLLAADLLETAAPATGRARLWGMLIGAELAAARPYWLGREIALIGAQDLSAHYARALGLQGVPATQTDADRITLAGLTAAWRQIRGTA